MDILKELEEHVNSFGAAPVYGAMPRRTLGDKGIAGPTGAHVIEEVHTPFNFAFLTLSTGTTAFQNIIGVTRAEIPDRIAASHRALEHARVPRNSRILFTYPPLVNVFLKEALEAYGADWFFLKASSRDALLLALCRESPDIVVGESSFLRAALEDAVKLGLRELLPKRLIFLAAGTPLDMAFAQTAATVCEGAVHDLYGCQEFGWLTLDGIPLREDIALIPGGDDLYDLVVGGLATGDRFPVLQSGHVCNREGKIITYSRQRSPVLETTIMESVAKNAQTAERLCASVLRIKARVAYPDFNMKLGAPRTVVSLARRGLDAIPFIVEGPVQTRLLDSLLQAQLDYQGQNKTDPAWIKRR